MPQPARFRADGEDHREVLPLRRSHDVDGPVVLPAAPAKRGEIGGAVVEATVHFAHDDRHRGAVTAGEAGCRRTTLKGVR